MKYKHKPTQRELNINKKRRSILENKWKHPTPHADCVGRERERRVYRVLSSLVEGEDKSHGIVGYAPSGKLSDADLEGIDVFISYKKDKHEQVKILKMGISGTRFMHHDEVLYPDVVHIPVDASYSDEDLKNLIISKIKGMN